MKARFQPQQQRTQAMNVPAPMRGIMTSVPLSEMDKSNTITTINMRSNAYGLSVRKGYRQWCLNRDIAGDGIKTIIPGNSSGRLNTGDKLFCTTNDGIYEITTFGAQAVKRVDADFPNKSPDAGWCSWHNFTNAGGLQYILICDLINGYYFYDFDEDTFSKVEAGTGPGKINGVNPAEFCFVTVWKNRVWFVQRDSTRGWYLDTVGIFTGKVTPFDFGSKMRYGGFLKGLYSWTLDAGVGVDDHLVATSSEGDIIVYTGTDPTTAGGFGMKGVWFIGETPRGRRGCSEFGGDLLVASQFGLVPLSRMVSGMADTENLYITQQINPLYRLRYEEREQLFGFEAKFCPAEGLVFILWPKLENRNHVQLAYEPTTQSWTVYEGVPALTIETYRGKTYIGTRDNEIFTLEAGPDRVMLDEEVSPLAIDFGLISSFSDLGMPATFKRAQFIRPVFIADNVPSYAVAARYDYDISDIGATPPYSPFTVGVWNDALWDIGKWGGGYQIDQPVYGAEGMGRTVAIILRGTSSSQGVVLAGFDFMLDTGGML